MAIEEEEFMMEREKEGRGGHDPWIYIPNLLKYTWMHMMYSRPDKLLSLPGLWIHLLQLKV
jgi:hypothetical protein